MVEARGPVFVVAEQKDEGIQPVSLQLLGKARQLADALGTDAGAVFLGHTLANVAAVMIEAGADLVFQADSALLVPYQAELYTQLIVDLAVEYRPEALLIGSTFMGRELAPLIAAKLQTGLAAHCTDLAINAQGILEQRIPAFGGMMTIVCPEQRPQMATVAHGVFHDPALNSSRSGQVIPVEVPTEFPLRAQTLEIVTEKPEGVPLESASLIVAGGAGAGDEQGWRQIAELAQVLNAGLGSTRPAVDSGWTELETMIGQSGKIVHPEVYIGVGLSGELQHLVGVVGARTMIAINNDPKAPVFQQVDFGIVEDCRVFVPALVEALKNREASARRATHVN